MPGEIDPLYVLARSVLLDALDALGAQRKAVILIGAQAIYLHTAAIEFAVAEYTTDADIALDPAALKKIPEIESAMLSAGFRRGNRVGAWCISREVDHVIANVDVDLMVPAAVGGAGSRAARLAGHARHVARKARGLEAALIDKSLTTIRALDLSDKRSFPVAAAGPAALLVSKLHKKSKSAWPNRNNAAWMPRTPWTCCGCCGRSRPVTWLASLRRYWRRRFHLASPNRRSEACGSCSAIRVAPGRRWPFAPRARW